MVSSCFLISFLFIDRAIKILKTVVKKGPRRSNSDSDKSQ